MKVNKYVACFPLYPPLELFHSMGLEPIVLWGVTSKIDSLTESDRHVQSYACSIARQLVQCVLSENALEFEGIFTYNACDTLRNIPEILVYALKENEKILPWYRVHIPMRSHESDYVQDYLQNEFKNLIRKLENQTGEKFSLESFRNSVNLHDELRALLIKIETLVAEGKASFAAYIKTLFSHHFEPLTEKLEILRAFEEELDSLDKKIPNTGTKNIMLSGIMPPSLEIIKEIENSGFRIVGNDLGPLTRSNLFLEEIGRFNSPEEYYSQFYKHHFPCTTLLYTAEKRFKVLGDLMAEKHAEGIIFVGEKFCEYEYFEFPAMETYFKEKGFKVLPLELSQVEGSENNFQAIKTRIETFSEMFDKN